MGWNKRIVGSEEGDKTLNWIFNLREKRPGKYMWPRVAEFFSNFSVLGSHGPLQLFIRKMIDFYEGD